jgi:hypothetical protein
LGTNWYCATTFAVQLSQKQLESKIAQTAFSAMTDSIIRDTQRAIAALAITVSAELGALAMIYVSKDKLLDFIDKQGDFWIYASFAAFLIGFFATFAAIRLMPQVIKQLFFSLTVWVISIGVGLANVALFYWLLTFQIQ